MNVECLPRNRLLKLGLLTCGASPGVRNLVNFERSSREASICLENYNIKDIIIIIIIITKLEL